MPRAVVVLAVAVLAASSQVAASELPLPVPELGSAPFVAGVRPHGVATASPAAPPLARLAWVDPTGVARGTEAVVRPEVARLLRGAGIATEWRRAEPAEAALPGELRVIFLDRATQRTHGAPVLGATPASFLGERFVWVHVPTVCVAAGVGSRSTGPNRDLHAARQLGIALSRVIVHEVVHALAPSVPHGSGLMAARLDQAMLTASSVRIDPEVALAVRFALQGALPSPAATGDLLAAESGREGRDR